MDGKIMTSEIRETRDTACQGSVGAAIKTISWKRLFGIHLEIAWRLAVSRPCLRLTSVTVVCDRHHSASLAFLACSMTYFGRLWRKGSPAHVSLPRLLPTAIENLYACRVSCADARWLTSHDVSPARTV